MARGEDIAVVLAIIEEVATLDTMTKTTGDITEVATEALPRTDEILGRVTERGTERETAIGTERDEATESLEVIEANSPLSPEYTSKLTTMMITTITRMTAAMRMTDGDQNNNNNNSNSTTTKPAQRCE